MDERFKWGARSRHGGVGGGGEEIHSRQWLLLPDLKDTSSMNLLLSRRGKQWSWKHWGIKQEVNWWSQILMDLGLDYWWRNMFALAKFGKGPLGCYWPCFPYKGAKFFNRTVGGLGQSYWRKMGWESYKGLVSTWRGSTEVRNKRPVLGLIFDTYFWFLCHHGLRVYVCETLTKWANHCRFVNSFFCCCFFLYFLEPK